LIGATGALLASNRPFGFVALLGLIALAGTIMRNTVILVAQIERDIAAGHARYRAIIDATVRRARPVVLTALAAVLGMIPLARSIFWGPMAITIMGGLLVATVLTLLVVPALTRCGSGCGAMSPTDRRSWRKRTQSTSPIWNRSGLPRSDRGSPS
jgi:multidrug efflux pump